MGVFGGLPGGAGSLERLRRMTAGQAPSLHTFTGDGVTSSFVITHDRRTRDLTVMVRLSASPWTMIVAALDSIEFTTPDTLTLNFSGPPGNGVEYTVKLSPA